MMQVNNQFQVKVVFIIAFMFLAGAFEATGADASSELSLLQNARKNRIPLLMNSPYRPGAVALVNGKLYFSTMGEGCSQDLYEVDPKAGSMEKILAKEDTPEVTCVLGLQSYRSRLFVQYRNTQQDEVSLAVLTEEDTLDPLLESFGGGVAANSQAQMWVMVNELGGELLLSKYVHQVIKPFPPTDLLGFMLQTKDRKSTLVGSYSVSDDEFVPIVEPIAVPSGTMGEMILTADGTLFFTTFNEAAKDEPYAQITRVLLGEEPPAEKEEEGEQAQAEQAAQVSTNWRVKSFGTKSFDMDVLSLAGVAGGLDSKLLAARHLTKLTATEHGGLLMRELTWEPGEIQRIWYYNPTLDAKKFYEVKGIPTRDVSALGWAEKGVLVGLEHTGDIFWYGDATELKNTEEWLEFNTQRMAKKDQVRPPSACGAVVLNKLPDGRTAIAYLDTLTNSGREYVVLAYAHGLTESDYACVEQTVVLLTNKLEMVLVQDHLDLSDLVQASRHIPEATIVDSATQAIFDRGGKYYANGGLPRLKQSDTVIQGPEIEGVRQKQLFAIQERKLRLIRPSAPNSEFIKVTASTTKTNYLDVWVTHKVGPLSRYRLEMKFDCTELRGMPPYVEAAAEKPQVQAAAEKPQAQAAEKK